ncbi:MAG: HPr family phosphocarrier protein [Clostridia bacterium]|jgi:phosphotransferase system HPr (HPr) family protein|nr:HPr family phosphocarrier protein [Clostridia bacterium]
MISREVTVKRSFDSASGAALNHRPISQFVGIATRYTDCRIWILHEDRRLNAKSYLGICSLGITKGMTVTLTVDGTDEATALSELENFLTSEN